MNSNLTNGHNGKTKGADITDTAHYLRTEPVDLLSNPTLKTTTGYATTGHQSYITSTPSKPGLIYTKMSQVMKDIAHISKDQTNSVQGFKFRGIDQFVNALYPALTKHGVFMTPSLDSETHELREVTRSNGKQGVDKHVHIQMSYTFYAEDGSYIFVGPIPAEAVDSGDKATNKALSAALKYALIQTFSIPTEDMAEADLDSPEIGIDVKNDLKTDYPKTPLKTPNKPTTRFTPPVRQTTPKIEDKTNEGVLMQPLNGVVEISETIGYGQTAVTTPTIAPVKKVRGKFNAPVRKTEVREE